MKKNREYNYLGVPVSPGLSAANMTLCEQMHLTANGCSKDDYDPDCEECPFNLENSKEPTAEGEQRYDETGGYYDEYPCTCLETCPISCTGQCGCKACHATHVDYLGGVGDW